METGKPTFGKERVRHAGSISILLPQAAHSSQIITYKSSQPGIQSNTWTVLVILFQYERDTNSQILKTISESDPPVKLCVFDINKLFCLYSKAFPWLLMSLLVINTVCHHLKTCDAEALTKERPLWFLMRMAWWVHHSVGQIKPIQTALRLFSALFEGDASH